MLRSNNMARAVGRAFSSTYARLEAAAIAAARRNDAMLLYVPDNPSNVLQFSAGYTPSPVGTPVGRWLDMQYGAPTLGPELLPNTGFTSGLDGWAQVLGTIAQVGGRLRATRGAVQGGRATAAITCIPGRTYRVTADRYLGGVSSAGFVVAVSPTSTVGSVLSNYGVTGPFSAVFLATQVNHWIALDTGTGSEGQYCEYDNVSVREVIEAQTTLGGELISNGAFAPPGTGWSVFPNGGTITINAGAAVLSEVGNSSPVINNLSLAAGKTYVIQFDVSGYAAGGVRIESGSAGLYGLTRSMNGTYAEMLTAAGSGSFALKAVGVSTSLTIDNVSVKEVLTRGSRGLELLANTDFSSWSGDNPVGWNLSMAETASEYATQAAPGLRIVSTAGNFAEVARVAAEIGKTYEATVVVSACTGAGAFANASITPVSFTAPGVYRGIFVAVNTSVSLKRASAGVPTDFTVTSVSLKEVPGYHGSQVTAASKPTLVKIPRKKAPDLVANGGFDSSDGWTTVSATIASGVLPLVNQFAYAQQDVAVRNGAYYELTYTVTATSGAFPLALSGTGFTGATTVLPAVLGRNVMTVQCVNTTGVLKLIAPNAGTSVTIDDVSLREITEWSNAVQFDGTDDWLDVTYRDYFTGGAYTFVGAWYGPVTGNSSFGLVQSSLTNVQPLCSPFFIPIGSTGASLFERGDTGTAGLSGSSYVTAGLSDTCCVELAQSAAGAVGNYKGWKSGALDKNINYTHVTEPVTTNKITVGAAQRTAVSGYAKMTAALLCWSANAMPDADRKAIARFAAFLVGAQYG